MPLLRIRLAGLRLLVLAPLREARARGTSIAEIDLPVNDHGKGAEPSHDERNESKIELVSSTFLAPPVGVILEDT